LQSDYFDVELLSFRDWEMQENYYVERKQARGALYHFVKAWRPHLRKMGLSLAVEQSDVLGETANVIFRAVRGQSGTLAIRVAQDGQYEATLVRPSSPVREGFLAELGARNVDELLSTARKVWTKGPQQNVSLRFN
jgi:hypothetical protein